MKAYLIGHPDTREPYTFTLSTPRGDVPILPLFFSFPEEEPSKAIERAHKAFSLMKDDEEAEVVLVDVTLADVV